MWHCEKRKFVFILPFLSLTYQIDFLQSYGANQVVKTSFLDGRIQYSESRIHDKCCCKD